jgi:hypothetical protein
MGKEHPLVNRLHQGHHTVTPPHGERTPYNIAHTLSCIPRWHPLSTRDTTPSHGHTLPSLSLFFQYHRETPSHHPLTNGPHQGYHNPLNTPPRQYTTLACTCTSHHPLANTAYISLENIPCHPLEDTIPFVEKTTRQHIIGYTTPIAINHTGVAHPSRETPSPCTLEIYPLIGAIHPLPNTCTTDSLDGEAHTTLGVPYHRETHPIL